MVKGIWSIIISLPVLVMVMFLRNPQTLITYTGGFCGVFILFIVPMVLVFNARKRAELNGVIDEENFNKSPFQHIYWQILIMLYALLTIVSVIVGLTATSN